MPADDMSRYVTICLCISPDIDGYQGTKNETLSPRDPQSMSPSLWTEGTDDAGGGEEVRVALTDHTDGERIHGMLAEAEVKAHHWASTVLTSEGLGGQGERNECFGPLQSHGKGAQVAAGGAEGCWEGKFESGTPAEATATWPEEDGVGMSEGGTVCIMGQTESSSSSASNVAKEDAKPQLQQEAATSAASAHTSPSASPPSHHDPSPPSPASTVSKTAEPSVQFISSPLLANGSRASSGGRLTLGALEGVIGGEKFQISVAQAHVKKPTLKAVGEPKKTPARPAHAGDEAEQQASRVCSKNGGADEAGCVGDKKEEVGEKRSRDDDGPCEFLESVRRADIGKIVEMWDDDEEKWVVVRVLDVIHGEVQVCPENESAQGRQSFGIKWVDYEDDRFRKHTPAPQPEGASVSSGDDPRSMRVRDADPVSRAKRIAATPESRAMALERGGGGLLSYSPEKTSQLRVRKRSRRDAERRRQRAEEAAKPPTPPPAEPARPPPPPPVPARKKDWGLVHVDVVGRHRPPFAKTILCHGTVQPGVRWSGEGCPAGQWVVKRWSDKSARRKVDFEVHEKIRANPCAWVVEIAGVHSHDGVLMEFCREGDLQTMMSTSRRKYTPVSLIARLCSHILRALEHLHSLKIVHSDVSPGNTFLRKDANGHLECVLGDFGHSYVVEVHAESRSSVHQGQGSLFVAPEVTSGSSSSMASDIYSAGRILEQMLCSSKQFKEEFAKESKVLVRTLENLAKDMLQEDVKRRPSSKTASEMLMRVLPREPTPKAAARAAALAAKEGDEA